MYAELFSKQISKLKSISRIKLGVEGQDSKLYITDGFYRYITRLDSSLFKSDQYYEVQKAENIIAQFFIENKGFIPHEDGHVVVCTLENGKLEFRTEFTISTVQPVIIEDKIVGYQLYCNRQEVKKYGV